MKFILLAGLMTLSLVFVAAENEPLCLEDCVLDVCNGLANETCWCITQNDDIARCVAAHCSASDQPLAAITNQTICGYLSDNSTLNASSSSAATTTNKITTSSSLTSTSSSSSTPPAVADPPPPPAVDPPAPQNNVDPPTTTTTSIPSATDLPDSASQNPGSQVSSTQSLPVASSDSSHKFPPGAMIQATVWAAFGLFWVVIRV